MLPIIDNPTFLSLFLLVLLFTFSFFYGKIMDMLIKEKYMKKLLPIVKNIVVSAVIIIVVYWINVFLKFTLHINSMIPMLYVLGVFFIAICTDGYIYSIASAAVSAFLVNHMFTQSGNGLEYTYNIITSVAIILFVSLLTCTVTTTIKKQRRIKEASIREHMRANLMRAVSHDLRTPLTSIYASSSAILDNFDDFTDEQRIELVKDIRTESHGLIRLVENLLSVTKINNENVELTMTDTVLEELIDSVAVKYNRHFPEMPLTLDIPEEFVSIPMDAMLIEQVLFNLLENSVVHGVGMTELILRVTLEGDEVNFDIRDNGCGLPKDKLDKVFYEYHDSTLVNTDMISRRNMGIGLSVCYAIIKAHNSTLSAENNSDGGASFKFSLRRSKNE